MTIIKKITTKTIFLVTAIIGMGFFPVALWKLFFGKSEINLTKLGSVTSEDANTSNALVPIARADVPLPPDVWGGGTTGATATTGDGGGDATTGDGGSADGGSCT